jgi:SAM-dependent methyltransferase
MTHHQKFYPEYQFGTFTRVDGTIAFFTRINGLLSPAFTVLDVGCGRAAYLEDPVSYRRNLRILKGKVSKVIGIDVDPEAQGNQCLDEFRLITGPSWPVDDAQVNLIVCDSVLEHIEDPDLFFAQARRVLMPGGVICLRTPNSWGYVALISRLIPNGYKTRLLAKAQEARKDCDVFRTFYRCNSTRKLRRALTQHGFECAVYGHESEPQYFAFSRLAYAAGVLHQRIAPQCLKLTLFAFGRRRE